jgi:hypothetical protein
LAVFFLVKRQIISLIIKIFDKNRFKTYKKDVEEIYTYRPSNNWEYSVKPLTVNR